MPRVRPHARCGREQPAVALNLIRASEGSQTDEIVVKILCIGFIMVAQAILNEAVRRLVEQFDPEAIILFGSQARGTADESSDVDLLVICPLRGVARRDVTLAMDLSLRGLDVARDVIVMTREEFERLREIPGTVARPAWQEGRVLYDRAA